MRLIFNIALLFTFLLSCVYAFAGEMNSYVHAGSINREEYKASWESEECSRITGESVIKSLRRGESPAFRMNALCSPESIDEMNRLKEKLVSVIEGEKKIGRFTCEGLVAAGILESLPSYDLAGLTPHEKRLVEITDALLPDDTSCGTPGFTCGVPSGDEIGIYTQGSAVQSYSGGAPLFRKIINNFTVNKNTKLPGRVFEIAHADYYRLFLYMRDDTGASHYGESTYRFHSSLSHFFNPVIHHKQLQHKEQDSIAGITIHQLCCSIPVFTHQWGGRAGVTRLMSISFSHHISQSYHNSHGGVS